MAKITTYRTCFVPLFTNTTKSTPNKIFASVPQDVKLCKKWFNAVRRDNLRNSKSNFLQIPTYCEMCEKGFVKANSNNLPKIDMFMVFEFLRSDDRFNAPEIRCAKGALACRVSYGDAAIGYVQFKREGHLCTLKCRVCPEHRVRSKTYSTTLVINESTDKIIDIQCHDCAAATGKDSPASLSGFEQIAGVPTLMSGAASLDDTAMTSSSSFTSSSDVNRVLRLTGAKSNSRLFNFPWKPHSADDKNDTRITENAVTSPDNHSNSKISNGFFKNIKKRLRIKNLSLCKAKQKIKAIDSQRQSEDCENAAPPLLERPLLFAGEGETAAGNERVISEDSDSWLCNGFDETLQSEAEACWESYSALGDRGNAAIRENETERNLRLAGDLPSAGNDGNEEEASGLRAGNVAEPQSTIARESIEDGADSQISNESKAKVNLSEELLKLSKYGWYWGPISGDEADAKLVSEPDGAFLVRDSSDDRYLLTLSFKSSGRLLHARMEHSGGLFSLCNQGENERFTSVAALIDHSMNSSQSAVFCYSRPRYPGYPSFPVRLTKPVSRFTQVRTLQYLCRFVIRQNTTLDNIHKLPLPNTIRRYIEEAHY